MVRTMLAASALLLTLSVTAAPAPTAARSTILSMGLVGLSIQTIRVLGLSACATVAGSVMST